MKWAERVRTSSFSPNRAHRSAISSFRNLLPDILLSGGELRGGRLGTGGQQTAEGQGINKQK